MKRAAFATLALVGALVGLLALDLHALPADDEAAIAELMHIKGIGRWSAEIYLLFAEQCPDIWPAGDLAVTSLSIESGGVQPLR